MTDLELGGVATGVGSMPGTDVAEATRMVFGEVALPHLPELPARGVGADLLGRTAAMLVDLPTEVVPSGYRVAERPGRDARRGADLLERDLDVLHDMAGTPRVVKVSAAGPWTLAAGVELPRGQRVLTDDGALRDFAASLVEGLRVHVAEVGRRTGASVLVQLDEPALPRVLVGGLRTPSGYGHLPAVPAPEVQRLLGEVVDAARQASGMPVVLHCCAPLSGDTAAPVAVLRAAGADVLSLDISAFPGASTRVADEIGEAIEDGAALLLGLVPSSEPAQLPDLHALAAPALELTDRLGFGRGLLASAGVTPTCGLARASAGWAERALRRCGELARALQEPPESW